MTAQREAATPHQRPRRFKFRDDFASMTTAIAAPRHRSITH
jgi:hypothetical protein